MWMFPCVMKVQKTQRKLGTASLNTVQQQRSEGAFVSGWPWSPTVIHNTISSECVLVASLFLEPLKTLVSFNETFLFVTSKFNLSVTGMAALVSKLHGGPVVVCASLHEVEWRGCCGVSVDVVNGQ